MPRVRVHILYQHYLARHKRIRTHSLSRDGPDLLARRPSVEGSEQKDVGFGCGLRVGGEEGRDEVEAGPVDDWSLVIGDAEEEGEGEERVVEAARGRERRREECELGSEGGR